MQWLLMIQSFAGLGLADRDAMSIVLWNSAFAMPNNKTKKQYFAMPNNSDKKIDYFIYLENPCWGRTS